MTSSKALIVAKTDLKMVMKVKWAKYSIILLSGLGPLIVIATLGLMILFVPADDPSYQLLLSMLIPLSSSMIALIAVLRATLIADTTLVGEREMNTLEPLLCSPLTDRELLWGKTLSSLIPTVGFMFSWTAITALVINILALVAGKPFVMFPDLPGLFLIFVAGPVVVLAIVSSMIIVSGRVKRVYEAYQSGSMVALVLIIPMFVPMMIMGENSMIDQSVTWLTNISTFLIAVVIASVTWMMALKTFNRDSLISRK